MEDMSAVPSQQGASTEVRGTHSPEPWHLEGPGGTAIWSLSGMVMGQAYPRNKLRMARANAERIIACVNFCEGHTTEYLERMIALRIRARSAMMQDE